MPSRRSIVATSILLALAATLAAPRGARTAAPPGGSAPPKTIKAGPRPTLPRSAALPDSVLARVGRGRLVTVSSFDRAWGQIRPPARPDSLTPETARQFLDLLIDKEVLAENARAQSFAWTPTESAQYLGLRDQLMLKAALDSALHEARIAREARGDSVRDPQVLGVAVRDSTFARQGVTFDDAVLERLAKRWAAIPKPSRDSSIWSQLRIMGIMPVVDPADSQLVIATSGTDRYRVVDLLDSWKRTNPMSRPRVETASQVRDLAKNGLYERLLRRRAEERRVDRRPDIAATLADRREYFAVAHLVDREVYKRLPGDSLTLLAWYRAHVKDYDLPDRVQIIRMLLDNRAEAGRMAARLRTKAEAETLVASGQRAGVNYGAEITAESDSATFHPAMRAGVGAVLGPDSLGGGGWVVVRVAEIHPARSRTFDEAIELVRHQYYGVRGEERMRELIDRLKAKTSVAVNDRGVRQLAARSASR